MQQAPMFWLAALIPLTIAAQIAVAPALFDSAPYAPIRPFLAILAVVFVLGGAGAAVALTGLLPARLVAVAPAVAGIPIGIMALNFTLAGVFTGTVTYGLIAAGLLTTMALRLTARRVRGRVYVHMTGAIVLALGAFMALAPDMFANTATYAQFGNYLWLFAPLFVLAGGGLIVTERSGRTRVMLSFASLAAVDLAVLVLVFASTHIWTGVLVYGLLAVVLMLAAPRMSVALQSPVLFASLAAVAAAGDLVNGLLAAVGGTPVVPTWTLMRIPTALGLLLVSIGFALALHPSAARMRRVAIVLGIVAACGSAAAFIRALASPELSGLDRVATIRGEAPDTNLFISSPQGVFIVGVAAVVLILYATRPRWRVTTQAFVLFGSALQGLVALNLLAYMLDSQFLLDVYGNLALRQHTTVAFGALALSIVAAGIGRLILLPIGDRVLGMLGALAVLVVTRNYLADAALAHVFVDINDLFYVEFLQSVESARSLMLVLIGVLAVGAGAVFTRTVTQPLDELLRAIARARAGEARAHADVEGSDEIGTVARSFNQLTRELADQSELYAAMRQAQSDLGDAILILEGGEPRQWNDALATITGYAEAELRAMPTVLDLWPVEERAALATVLKTRSGDTYRLDTRLTRSDGQTAELEMAIIPLPGTASGQQLAVVRDITERRHDQRALERQALFDGLTQLPNRALLRDRLDRTIAAAQRASDSFSLLYLDLDRFKEVNDAFGHDDGDSLLKAVADRLGSAITNADTLARFGGDEFAILLPRTRDLVEAAGMGELVRALLMKPFDLRGHRVFVEASIGIVLFPADGADSDTLLRRADIAMYQAKRAGKGIVAYQAEHDPQSQRRLDLLGDLRQAIARSELFLHYQPQKRIGDGTSSFEALLRWRHPVRGMVPPSEFIPLAEESGFINEVALFVVREVVRDIATLGSFVVGPNVALNLSARNLHLPGLVEAISAELSLRHVDPSALTIEITETAVMSDAKRSLQTLTSLSDLGVRLSIDDFGAGYSSLGYLRRLPVKELKIDRSFVMDMLSNASSDAIVTSTIQLGHLLGLEVVAEGVEDAATLAALAYRGCDLAQGYHIARPMPFSDLAGWLSTQGDDAARAVTPIGPAAA